MSKKRLILFRYYCQQQVRGRRLSLDTQFQEETKGWRDFKSSGRWRVIGQQYLRIGLTQRKSKLSPICKTGGSFITQSKKFSPKLNYPPTNTELWTLSVSMITLQRDNSQVFKKDISWVVKPTRDWEKIYIHFKRAEKVFLNFLKQML